MKISFIIPTLNEVNNVPLAIDLIKKSIAAVELDYEIIFVDDKSTDGTIEKINEFSRANNNIKMITPASRMGLGNALKLGTKEANGNLVLYLDCDVSIQAEDLIALLKNADENKMLIGSRYIKGGKTIGAPKLKVFLSKLLNRFISKYLHLNAIDISHSLRVFPAKKIKMPDNNTHPAFFWELSVIGANQGLSLCEIPITFRERKFGSSKNSTKTMIKSVLKGMYTLTLLRGTFK